MRLGVVLSILVFVVFGALFGALNAQRTGLDLYFVQLSVPKGAALLTAFFLGWLLGGLVAWLGGVPRLKRELRSSQRALREAREKGVVPGDAP
ncbi:MAG TPA: LapA family protein [Rhodanobacteraceae bacterium]|nr:LapA family protein [Rhodanobacteraceae bacterium]